MIAPLKLPAPPEPDPHGDPIATAVAAELCERGYEATTAAGVARRAGVDQEEFDRRYSSLDECILESYERFIAVFKRRVGGVFNRNGEWRAALRAAAYETADWMVENPTVIGFGTIEVLKVPNELVRVRREEVFDFCAEMIDRGREAAPDPEAIPEAAATIAIGGIFQLLTHRMQEGAAVDPYDVIPEMMHRIVSTYRGPEAAQAELTMPRPAA